MEKLLQEETVTSGRPADSPADKDGVSGAPPERVAQASEPVCA